VASALNTVQRSATDLAFEQAVLRRNIADAFVNLGRRNQALLTRLLDSITDMERNQADPDELHKLFTLDHLATRMRRNAESLVVLAGVETRRQWASPVPIIDVIRGAMGEVEDYERVEIGHLDEVLVKGKVVAELTHVVAELLENALTYSPPDRSVQIRGYRRADGYQLAIVDRGVGLPPDDLAVANNRLSGHESFTVAPSRYLGHYVVGLHSSRLGLRVTLHDTLDGTTAVIGLAAVVTTEAAEPAPAPRRPGTRETRTALPAAPAATKSDGADAQTLSGVRDSGGAATAEVAVASSSHGTGPTTEPATTASGYKRRVRNPHAPNTSSQAEPEDPDMRRD
jgi:anti-sigma regulatory factor (Ser/Thr protein kinase)